LSADKENLQPFVTIDFQDIQYQYDDLLEKSNVWALHIRRHISDALFLIHIHGEVKCCPTVTETVSIGVPALST
jgi:hypothetical protein